MTAEVWREEKECRFDEATFGGEDEEAEDGRQRGSRGRIGKGKSVAVVGEGRDGGGQDVSFKRVVAVEEEAVEGKTTAATESYRARAASSVKAGHEKKAVGNWSREGVGCLPCCLFALL